jgi:2Fe-2S ferredoxin
MSATHEVSLSNGEKLQVSEDKSLLEALREAGIYIKSSCGGVASCSDCLIKITEGVDNINAPSFEETKLIGNVFHITKERLSCQTRVTGPISIDISAHDPTADAKKTLEKNKKFIKPKSPVKKRSADEVKAIHQERHQARKEKEEKRNSWQKHWEREDERKFPGSGGSKRPKTFRTDFEEKSDVKKEDNKKD